MIRKFKAVVLYLALMPLLAYPQSPIFPGVLNPVGSSVGTVTVANSCNAAGTSTAVASYSCSITGVTAGDLIVGCIGILNTASQASYPMTDGTTSFTLDTLVSTTTSNLNQAQCGHQLSANSGNLTYSVSCPNGTHCTFGEWFVVQIHSTLGSWHFDTQASAANTPGTTKSTASNSGTFTTSGTTEAIVWSSKLYTTAATTSSASLGGYTPSEFSFSPMLTYDHKYYLFNQSVSGVAATLTYSTATYWTSNVVAFKAY